MSKMTPEAIVGMDVSEFEKMRIDDFEKRCPDLYARVRSDVYTQVYDMLEVIGAADVVEQVDQLRKTGLSLEKIKAMDQAGLLQKPITQKEIEAKKEQEQKEAAAKEYRKRDMALKMEILEGLKAAHGGPVPVGASADTNLNPNSLVGDANRRAMQMELKKEGR